MPFFPFTSANNNQAMRDKGPVNPHAALFTIVGGGGYTGS